MYIFLQFKLCLICIDNLLKYLFYVIIKFYLIFQVSFKHELIEEIKFILKCKGSTKPVRKGKSEAGDTSDDNSGSLHPYGGYPSDKKHPLE